MKRHVGVALIMVAAFALAGRARAACPAGLVNPVYFLDGTRWSFLTQDGLGGDGQIGIFTATAQPPSARNPYYSGVLSGTQTSNTVGSIVVRAQFSGRYQVNDTCTGGTLFFNINNNSFQYKFVVAGPNQMFILSESQSIASAPIPVPSSAINKPAVNPGARVLNAGLGTLAGNRGVATRLTAAAQCPAGTSSPQDLLAGNWSFITQDYGAASIGMFTAQPQPSSYTGYLRITQTTNGWGFLAVDEAFDGSYQVYPDCSGGSLVFPYGGDGFEYEFVFAGPTKIYMVSSNTGFVSNTNGVFRGRYGTAIVTP